jgi:segregation and condensation protein B
LNSGRDEKKALLEALLFVEGEGIETSRLLQYTGFSEEELRELITELKNEYEVRQSGLQIAEAAGGYQMIAHPRFGLALAHIFGAKSGDKLSRTSLEVLAITAYKQPVTKSEIEEIRGVSSERVIKVLLEKDLIGFSGRRESPGRPLEYTTTKNFLKVFNLASLKDLPKLRELKELEFEVNRENEEPK